MFKCFLPHPRSWTFVPLERAPERERELASDHSVRSPPIRLSAGVADKRSPHHVLKSIKPWLSKWEHTCRSKACQRSQRLGLQTGIAVPHDVFWLLFVSMFKGLHNSSVTSGKKSDDLRNTMASLARSSWKRTMKIAGALSSSMWVG